ncbi:copper resistance protein CopC (plasmid) [Pseudonocardia sp. DSM 110487]|uniref:copper resistance CopC family protein n=1 Tax=Pseudonocardia sp. DSM 110487 TaxID=2865833 RepID=UPI001C698C8B|nr:copper resistance CopC family protein [Pseudonocardia sp. DSM 110487]QYN41058.1 copper resistance protein CopC [Pseudonocardia sp. DSM 110487]
MTRILTPAVTRPAADVAAVVLLLAACWVWLSSPAYAHTQLVASDPPDGAVLVEPPRAVTLTLTEVDGTVSIITVNDPDGVPVSIGTPRLVWPGREIGIPATGRQREHLLPSDSLRVPLAALAKPGRYTTHYRITAADGHPLTGVLSFTLAPRPGPTDGGSTVPGGVDQARPAEVASAPAAAPGPEEESGPVWPWVVVGLVAIGVCAAAALRLKLVDLRR